MAAEDGDKEMFTATMGPDNRAPRVIKANIHAAAVAGHLIGHELFDQLSGIQRRIEALEAQAGTLVARTVAQIKKLGRAQRRLHETAEKIRREGLVPPNSRRKRFWQEVAWLGVLALGDMLLISLAFQLFGLSDQPILGFLPFSELQLAASAAIAALQVLARITGHRGKRCLHLVVVLLRDGDGGTRNDRQHHLAQVAETGMQFLAGVLGLVVLLVGLNEIRSSYLESVGVNAQGTSFLLIQLGIAMAGVLIAAHYAHPYDEDWRSVSETADEALSAVDSQVVQLTALKAEHGGLLRDHENTVAQYLQWEGAANRNVERQNELYARGVLLALPEPPTERLFENELPETASVDWAETLRDPKHRKIAVLTPKTYQPLDLSAVLDLVKAIEDDIVIDETSVETTSDEDEAVDDSADAPAARTKIRKPRPDTKKKARTGLNGEAAGGTP